MYVNNKFLLQEIEKSKITYCEHTDPKYARYDLHITDVSEITEKGVVYRLTPDWSLVPEAVTKKGTSRAKGGEGKMATPFTPFSTWILGDNGIECVGRAFRKNGQFSLTHGRLSRGLGDAIMIMAEKYSLKPIFRGYSYRDEMVAGGILQLSASALKFDASKTLNPFAFLTTTLHNSFIKVLKDEKKQRDIRDDLIELAGFSASHTRQLENDLNRSDVASHSPSPDQATDMGSRRGRSPTQPRRSANRTA